MCEARISATVPSVRPSVRRRRPINIHAVVHPICNCFNIHVFQAERGGGAGGGGDPDGERRAQLQQQAALPGGNLPSARRENRRRTDGGGCGNRSQLPDHLTHLRFPLHAGGMRVDG